MANHHMNRCATSYVIREMQIKTTMKYHYTHIRRAKIWNTDNTKYRQGCGTTGSLTLLWGMQNGTPLWETVW